MKVIYGLKNLKKPIKSSIATIGVFDGVHIAHKEILRRVVERSRKLGLPSVAVTFYPHPLRVLNQNARILSLVSLKHRVELIRDSGIDYLIVVNFTKSIADMPADMFVKNILIKKMGLREIYVGEDFFFGKGAKAGVNALKILSRDLGFRSVTVKPIKAGGKVVSSTLIRRLIMKGDIVTASRYLGRPVSILGTVVGGDRRGRQFGYPTANIDPHHEAIPPSGVYAVRAKFEGRNFKGVLNIGKRPTFHRDSIESDPVIEVHLFDFNEDIYGKDMEIIFIKKLRDESAFKDKDHLIEQIRKDIKTARALLL